jgi:hypothetical protein
MISTGRRPEAKDGNGLVEHEATTSALIVAAGSRDAGSRRIACRPLTLPRATTP